jgi:lactate permease
MLTILSILPIICLLLCLIVFKLPVTKSGAVSLVITLIIALVFFGMSGLGLSVAVGKALWLALFVSLIVWSALLLYHLVSDFGAIDVINQNITIFIKDKFVAFVLLAWLFTGLLQGIAGFGVPSVIVAPILIALGFNPVKSLAACLLGHSWAVTFGSMGAAFFVIQGITGVPEADLGFPMWVFNTCAHLLTGIGVCFIFGGFKGIAKGLLYVLPVSAVMTAVQFFIIRGGMFHLATIVTALSGLVVMFLLYKLRSRKTVFAETAEIKNTPKSKLNLLQSTFPYALILILLLSFQAIPAEVRNTVAVSFSFPETATTLETPYEVSAANNYNPIRLFVHPLLVLLIASVVACIIYKKAKIWDTKIFRESAKKTVKKGIPATLALIALGSTSLIMMDSGMTYMLANSTADLTGTFFPFISPFLGVLASFLTGNNTNANVLFGALQYEIASGLNLSTAFMTASQSISSSVGVAISPTLVLMGALATGQNGEESKILKKLIPIILIIALVMGIINFVLIGYFS